MNKKKLIIIFNNILINKIFSILFIFISCSDGITPPPKTSEKPGFCLTFDDTYIKDWNNIIDLLDSNHVKATFFLTHIYQVSPDEIEMLQNFQKRGHEIGCHGWKHLNAIEYLERNTIDDYLRVEVQPALNFMDSCGFNPNSFSYPYGMNTDSLDEELLNTFGILRDVTDEQRKPLEKNVADIDEIFFRFNNQRIISALGIDANFKISLEMLEGGFRRAFENNEVIVFYAHRPVQKITAPYQIEYDYLKELISIAKKNNLISYSFSELIK